MLAEIDLLAQPFVEEGRGPSAEVRPALDQGELEALPICQLTAGGQPCQPPAEDEDLQSIIQD
jgi:hypothetical protein